MNEKEFVEQIKNFVDSLRDIIASLSKDEDKIDLLI